jgi:hypothetical protein
LRFGKRRVAEKEKSNILEKPVDSGLGYGRLGVLLRAMPVGKKSTEVLAAGAAKAKWLQKQLRSERPK